VHRVDPRAAGQSHERAQPLADIGFVPGEAVSVVTHAWPGGDPLVVRVGHSRFALRRAEAACIQVLPADE
jgi:ferrous iron transport protein A